VRPAVEEEAYEVVEGRGHPCFGGGEKKAFKNFGRLDKREMGYLFRNWVPENNWGSKKNPEESPPFLI